MQDIKDYLSYNPDTGAFTWIKSRKHGSIAGTTNAEGYIVIKYKKYYRAHRLAWYFYYGILPLHPIDHINGAKDDNRICNLRLDINRENEQNNNKPQCNNTSGYRGVTWCKRVCKWIAKISIKGRRIFLGSFNTPEEAYEAYIKAKQTYHPFWSTT